MPVGQFASPRARAITARRAPRLVRLLTLLAESRRTRGFLTHKLRLDLRGFYRDLDLLRGYGVPIGLIEHHYRLCEPLDEALARLPLPDPRLNLREAIQLADGRTAAHRKLRGFIEQIIGEVPRRPRRK
jgi:hypothetical protein